MSRQNAKPSAFEPPLVSPAAAEVVDFQTWLPNSQRKKAETSNHQCPVTDSLSSLSLRWILSAQAIGMITLTLAAILAEILKLRWGADLLSEWHLWGLTQKFNFDSADSLPNFFQTATMLLSTLWLWLITQSKQACRDEYAVYWRGLTITFFLLALDEATNLHTMTVKPLRDLFHASHFLYFTWVVWGIAFVLVFGAAYIKFLRALPTTTRSQFIGAGLMFLSGAIGLEMVEGHFHTLYGSESPLLAAALISEEICEMAGILFFNHALLSYLGKLTQTTQASLRTTQQKTA